MPLGIDHGRHAGPVRMGSAHLAHQLAGGDAACDGHHRRAARQWTAPIAGSRAWRAIEAMGRKRQRAALRCRSGFSPAHAARPGGPVVAVPAAGSAPAHASPALPRDGTSQSASRRIPNRYTRRRARLAMKPPKSRFTARTGFGGRRGHHGEARRRFRRSPGRPRHGA